MDKQKNTDDLKVTLDRRHLDRLCPFFLLIDSDLAVVDAGHCMRYVLPEIDSGSSLDLMFERRDYTSAITFDSLVNTADGSITLASRKLPHFRFTGSTLELPGGELALLLLEPVATSTALSGIAKQEQAAGAVGTASTSVGPETTSPCSEPDLETLSILVIDDNEISRAVLAAQLRGANMLCDTSHSGAYGLTRMRDRLDTGKPYDCIFVDMNMPDLDGLEVARFIRADDRFNPTSLVLLTTFADQWTSADLTHAGFCDQIIKPIPTNQLLAQLQRLSGFVTQKRGSATGESYKPALRTSIKGTPEPGTQLPDDGSIDVLAVEDNAVNQLVLEQVFSRTPYSYLIVSSSEEAVAAFQKYKPRLVFMDTSLPGGNGIEATKSIRELEARSEQGTPVVGLLADFLNEDRQVWIDAGMDDCLTKPVSPDRLMGLLEKWLGDDNQKRVTQAAS